MNTFYSMGDSTVFLSIQVVCRNAEALGGAVAGIISVWLFTLDPLAPFFFAAALSGHWDVWAFSTITYLYHLYHLISHAWSILVEIRRVINQIEYDWVTRVIVNLEVPQPRGHQWLSNSMLASITVISYHLLWPYLSSQGESSGYTAQVWFSWSIQWGFLVVKVMPSRALCCTCCTFSYRTVPHCLHFFIFGKHW